MSCVSYAYITDGKGVRKRQRNVRCEDEIGRVTWRTEKLRDEAFEWTAEVDLNHLQHLALKAANNKNGRSCAGPVKITITKREVLNEP